MYLIYRIKNKINGKMYIGFTSRTLKKRFSEHVRDAAKGSEFALHRAIRKYGKDNFEIEILATDENNDYEFTCKIHEGTFIRMYDTFYNGYNMTLGGQGKVGFVITDETKQKMRDNHWSRKSEYIHPFKGKTHPCKGRKAKPFSEEHKQKMRDNHWSKRDGFVHPLKGKKRSQETRDKISRTKLYNVSLKP